MKILLVGANGQVGAEIKGFAAEKGISLVAFSRQQLDITDPASISTQLKGHVKDATCLVNAAAYTAVDKAEGEAELAFQVNCEAVENLARFCKSQRLPLLHLSTDYVFAGDKIGDYTEEDLPCPNNVYGKSKLAGEKILQQILPEHIILRVSWVFGKYGKNFVKTILRLAHEKETLKIVNDQHGNPTAAADIARVILTIATSIKQGKVEWGIYHYCNLPTVSWYEFAQSIVTVRKAQKADLMLKSIEPISTSEFPTPAMRPMNSSLNCDKIKRVFAIDSSYWHDYLTDVISNINENL